MIESDGLEFFVRYILPLIILGLGIGVCWGTIVNKTKNLQTSFDEKITLLTLRVTKIEDACMKEKDHKILCELNSTKIVNGVKDELMPEIRDLKQAQSDEMVGILKSLRDEIRDMNQKGGCRD